MDTCGFYSDHRNSLPRTSRLVVLCFGPQSVQRCENVMVLVFAGPPRIELVVSTLLFVVASHTLLERHHSAVTVISVILVLTFLLSSSHNLSLGGSKHPFLTLICGRCWPLEKFVLRGVKWRINGAFLSSAAPVCTFYPGLVTDNGCEHMFLLVQPSCSLIFRGRPCPRLFYNLNFM